MWLDDCSVLITGCLQFTGSRNGHRVRKVGFGGTPKVYRDPAKSTTPSRTTPQQHDHELWSFFRVDPRRTVEPPGDVVIRGRNRHRYSHPLTEENLPLVLVRQGIACASSRERSRNSMNLARFFASLRIRVRMQDLTGGYAWVLDGTVDNETGVMCGKLSERDRREQHGGRDSGSNAISSGWGKSCSLNRRLGKVGPAAFG